MKKLILFLLVFSSCSAEYHLRQAIKKNPKLGDSSVVLVPYYKDTNIVINIIGDTSDQTKKIKEWYKQAKDSMAIAFDDSFTRVSQTIDSIGNLKTKVIRKPYYINTRITIRETKYVKVPERITVKEEPFKIKWWWIALFGIGLFIVLDRK
jgi:hypothetical protein